MIKFGKIKGDIEGRLNSLEEKLKEFPDLLVVYLFGSYARGDENELSDIDLAFYFLKPDEELEIQLYEVVSSHLETDEITFISIRNAPLPLAYRIISEGIVIYERSKKERLEIEEKLNKLYLDFLPLYREKKGCYGI